MEEIVSRKAKNHGNVNTDHDCGLVIIEHSWHVLGRKFIPRVCGEQTGFSDSTVAHN